MKFKISIKNKIILLTTLLIIFLVVLQLVFNLFGAKDYYVYIKSQDMENVFTSIKNSYDGESYSITSVVTAYENSQSFDIIVHNTAGIIYTSYDKYVDRNAMQFKPGDAMNNFIYAQYEYEPEAVIGNAGGIDSISLFGAFEYEGEEVRVSIMAPMEAVESAVAIFVRTSSIIAAVVLFLAVIISILVSKSITKPIYEMEKVVAKLEKLDFSQKVNMNLSSSELQSLACNINSMSQQLEVSITKLQEDVDMQKQIVDMRKQFVANVSHEMKTPLALLQIYAENLKTNIDDVDKDYYCDTIIEETASLSDMVGSMLEISQVESGLQKMQFEDISLSELALDLASKTKPILEDFNLEINIEEGINIKGDAKYLEQAMRNFIINASEHGKKDGKIIINLKKIGDKIEFMVYNDGSNIPDDHIAHLWESFYRADAARIRSNKNLGLGLHIVKTVIDKHGGTCNVANMPGGVQFSFTL